MPAPRKYPQELRDRAIRLVTVAAVSGTGSLVGVEVGSGRVGVGVTVAPAAGAGVAPGTTSG
jgi:hypothetical protein